MTNDPSSTITYYMTGNPGDDTTSQSQPQVTYSRRAAVMIPASNLPTLTSTATAFSNAVSESGTYFGEQKHVRAEKITNTAQLREAPDGATC
jgi:hypothetical protein